MGFPASLLPLTQLSLRAEQLSVHTFFVSTHRPRIVSYVFEYSTQYGTEKKLNRHTSHTNHKSPCRACGARSAVSLHRGGIYRYTFVISTLCR